VYGGLLPGRLASGPGPRPLRVNNSDLDHHTLQLPLDLLSMLDLLPSLPHKGVDLMTCAMGHPDPPNLHMGARAVPLWRLGLASADGLHRASRPMTLGAPAAGHVLRQVGIQQIPLSGTAEVCWIHRRHGRRGRQAPHDQRMEFQD
jgi:hypothetical protein